MKVLAEIQALVDAERDSAMDALDTLEAIKFVLAAADKNLQQALDEMNGLRERVHHETEKGHYSDPDFARGYVRGLDRAMGIVSRRLT